jgi:hypothetical protein
VNEEQTKKMQQWAKIVAKAWADDDFKARLLSDPVSVLRAEGVDVPEGMTLKVVENTDAATHIVIPAKPEGGKAETLDVRVQYLVCALTF